MRGCNGSAEVSGKWLRGTEKTPKAWLWQLAFHRLCSSFSSHHTAVASILAQRLFSVFQWQPQSRVSAQCAAASELRSGAERLNASVCSSPGLFYLRQQLPSFSHVYEQLLCSCLSILSLCWCRSRSRLFLCKLGRFPAHSSVRVREWTFRSSVQRVAFG
jgi:hypothetical protein